LTWAGHPRTSTSSWKKLRPQILKRDGGRCHICGQIEAPHPGTAPTADIVDHKTPVSQGGTDNPDNLGACHEVPCHRRKTSSEAVAAKAKQRAARLRPVEPHPGLRRPPQAS